MSRRLNLMRLMHFLDWHESQKWQRRRPKWLAVTRLMQICCSASRSVLTGRRLQQNTLALTFKVTYRVQSLQTTPPDDVLYCCAGGPEVATQAAKMVGNHQGGRRPAAACCAMRLQAMGFC